MNAQADFFVTAFLRALIAKEPPIPLQIDGQPCLLVRGDLSAILLIFEDGKHLTEFHESVEQARKEQAGSSRIDAGMIHGPAGVIAIPDGASLRPWWQALKPGVYDGQLVAVRG